jgi:hypothetical protein
MGEMIMRGSSPTFLPVEEKNEERDISVVVAVDEGSTTKAYRGNMPLD